MSESYEQMLAALRGGTAFVFVDVQPPRDAPVKQFVASLFESPAGRPQGTPVSTVVVTSEQARELLGGGAEWKGPAHMRAELFPDPR